MTPTYAIKKGVRYRYYVSHHLVTGTRGEEGNGQTSGQRIPAANLEALAVQRLRSFFADSVAVIAPALAGMGKTWYTKIFLLRE